MQEIERVFPMENGKCPSISDGQQGLDRVILAKRKNKEKEHLAQRNNDLVARNRWQIGKPK